MVLICPHMALSYFVSPIQFVVLSLSSPGRCTYNQSCHKWKHGCWSHEGKFHIVSNVHRHRFGKKKTLPRKQSPFTNKQQTQFNFLKGPTHDLRYSVILYPGVEEFSVWESQWIKEKKYTESPGCFWVKLYCNTNTIHTIMVLAYTHLHIGSFYIVLEHRIPHKTRYSCISPSKEKDLEPGKPTVHSHTTRVVY